jgi:hypothetical protein
MLTATKKMAENFRSAVARVYRNGDSKGIIQRKHAMLWLFQVFALKVGLHGCQVWAISSLTYDSSKITSTHVLHLGFLKRRLGVKKGTLIRSRFQAKPATLLIPIGFSFPFCGGGALRYSVPKWLLFLN